MTAPPSPHAALPEPLIAISRTLAAGGDRTWLVGESLHELLEGLDPGQYQLATTATPATLLSRFPTLVPTRPKDGAFTLPTAVGPVDLCPLRHGRDIEADLAHRDFTLLAAALELPTGRWIDPHGRQADVEARRLRSVNDPARTLLEDPRRSLRAALWIARSGYAVDSALAAAMEAQPWPDATTPAVAVRKTLLRILTSPHAARAIELLRRTGLEDRLVPGGGRTIAVEIMDGLPADVGLRLAAWLPGASAGRFLARWRIDPRLARRVRALSTRHPLDAHIKPGVRRPALRLLERTPTSVVDALTQLREREILALTERGDADVAEVERARAALDWLGAVARQQTQARAIREAQATLAVDGQWVMQELQSGPGRHVGEALRHLAEVVAADPTRNAPDALLPYLRSWSSSRSE